MSQALTIEITRTDDPFARIPQAILNDPDLSWKAKGVLCYLLGKPSNWKVNVADLVKRSTDKEMAIRSALKELQRFGYAKLEKVRGIGGAILRWVWNVADYRKYVKDVKNPNVSPDRGFPHVGKQDVDNRYLSKNDYSKNESKKRVLPEIPEKLRSPKVEAAWAEWIEARKEQGRALSPKAASRHLQKLEKWGAEDWLIAIEASISADWQDLYPPKEKKNGSSTPAWKERQIVQELIEKHPANRDSIFYESPTAQQKEELSGLKKRFQELSVQSVALPKTNGHAVHAY